MPVALELNTGRVPVKVWTPDLEPEARRQLENVSRLPIVFGHIAAMPDVHAGIGATVGSVIPTRGAIVPAAVGVDIGCFTGDTEVILADSRRHRLDELAKRKSDFFVYACTADGRVGCATASARMTRRQARLVEVELDNGEKIRCTPDHRFMLRDATFAEAHTLRPEASLMPFYAQLDPAGYLRIMQPNSGKFQRSHWLVAGSGLPGPIPDFEGQRTATHPENLDESDNRPSNLHFMGDRDPSTLHRLPVERNTPWQSEEFEAGRVRALAATTRTAEGRACFAMRGTAGEEIPSPIALFRHRKSRHGVLANHKIVRVRELDEREDVYCLTVPGFENFALAAGVFVHNCGMNAVQLSLQAADLQDSMARLRSAIEAAVPVGFDMHPASKGRGSGREQSAKALAPGLQRIAERTPQIRSMQKDFDQTWLRQLGSLGGGNHFIEVCLDDSQQVWVMLHSGSRGIGNVIGRHFIERARREMERTDMHLPDRDLAWLVEGSKSFDQYVEAVHWAQDYATLNRREMMRALLKAIEPHVPPFKIVGEAISCHHNYVAREHHFGADVLVTRKGAIRAGAGDMGIIPGSMGAQSFIVRGKGNPESLCSCAHGAGRRMSRTEAKRRFTREDLVRQTEGVECRKDGGVIDEIPGAYKSIDEVMKNQSDLVEIVHTLKQVVCVKG
jgi:tRNA-splicing ligase RtcB